MRSLAVPIRRGETGCVVIRFLPCVFQGIFYLAKTVTLPQYKLCNNSLKSGICIVTPTVPENIKKKKKWPWLSWCPSSRIKRQLLRLVTLIGQNLGDLFLCDASTNVRVLHLLLVLNLALRFCSLNKQEGVHTVKKIKAYTCNECRVKDMLTAGRGENGF